MEISKSIIKKLFPHREKSSHKGDFGKVLIYAGSEGMLGAGILSSRGALRIGAGLVYLGIPKQSRDMVNVVTPEVIVAPAENARDILPLALKSDTLAIGPGLGKRRAIAKELLFKLAKNRFSAPIVLDADGLAAFFGDLKSLKDIKLNLILTPHPGEMAKLLSKTTKEIQNNRRKYAIETAKNLGCILVLKGHETVVADRSGKIFINKTGNPGMAAAGAGDVLCGMIAGLLAQNKSPLEAALAGVYLHGLAGDLAAREKGEYGMTASDLIEAIPRAILKIT